MSVITQRHIGEQGGTVAEITLDWPDVRNALGPVEGRELRLALEQALADESVGAIVLSANGKAFCAGGNLPAILELAKGGPDAVKDKVYGEFQGIFRAITTARVPVITAVEGPAIGFGCDLALAGNATFVGPSGWLAQGWIKAGLIPATGGTRYVKQRGGQQAVYRMLEADRVDGPTLEKWNLAIAADDARAAALAMAAKFAGYPRAPLEAVVQLERIDDRAAHLEAALDYQVGFITHPDFAAFAAKLLGK
ncbi:MAG: enoyl-CoA hydratase/isomerase family protein [Novosphingobium sp.]|nr:enoyl-CoA hydratase/isomerase family protein [Novosphingobium sp.]